MEAPLLRSHAVVDGTTAGTVLLGAVAFVAAWAIVAMWPGAAPGALDLWRGDVLLATHHIPHTLGVETFAASGLATGYQGWLGLWILGALNAFGGGAALGVVSGGFFAVALVLTMSRVSGLTAAVMVGLALAVATLQMGAGLIPCLSLAALATAAVTLAHLEDSALRYGLVCAVLTALWANVDARALFVPGLALLYALGAVIDARAFSLRAKHFAVVALATLLATCITPYGLDLPLRAGAHLGIGPGLSSLIAWQPSTVAPHAYWLVIVPLVLLAAAAGIGRHGDAAAVLCTIAALTVALSNGSYIADAVVLIGPIFALRLLPMESGPEGLGRFSAAFSVDRFAIAASALAVAAVVVATVAVFPALIRPAVAAPTLHDASLSALLDGREHRIACTTLVLCDEIVARGNPRLRVLMDDRVSAYPALVRHDQVSISTLGDGWDNAVKTRNIDAIAARKTGYIASVLALDPHWSLVADSDTAVLYRRVPVTKP